MENSYIQQAIRVAMVVNQKNESIYLVVCRIKLFRNEKLQIVKDSVSIREVKKNVGDILKINYKRPDGQTSTRYAGSWNESLAKEWKA